MEARSDDALRDALRPYARERRGRSVLEALLTALLLVAPATIAARASLPLVVRIAASGLEGLAIVRGFILFHDVMHGAIFRGSKVARAVSAVFGALVLTPPRVWRETHNYHHAHTAKIVGSNIGSYPMVTTDMWAQMSSAQRRAYRLTRHPLTILCAYFTVFALGMGILPFVRAPKKHAAAALIVALHLAAWVLAAWFHVLPTFLLAFAAPLFIACAIGAYLFYAQHNFPGIVVVPRERWTHVNAALHSSSFFEMGPVMHFFTGNIGFHHVHHLHAGIPFYRLPEVMRAVPELTSPVRTSFRPRDVIACLQLKLWDPARGTMVGYP